jgi:putative SOS response-associated peptidase YedK
MCNEYEQHATYRDYVDAVRRVELDTPSGETTADLPQADGIRIGDMGTVIRAAGNGIELIQMRFGFPPPRPKASPVFNFKSDGRHFADSRRCLVILSGFFEFTGTKYPKAKHRFSLKDSPLMAIAGLWREGSDGEPPSFTMLTTEPGPDIAPYHDRQVVVLRPGDWAHWLFLTRTEEELLRPLPAGSLIVETVRKGSD